MVVRRRFVVSGRVQGVGFRYFVYEAAKRENLNGWVRNRLDRTVEVEAEGESEAVARFERAVRVGPPHARVDHVETDLVAPIGQMTGFTIRG
jgi:acylphosphatase